MELLVPDCLQKRDIMIEYLRAQYIEEVEKLELTKSFLFIGRLAEYKYYNMDAVIEFAISNID